MGSRDETTLILIRVHDRIAWNRRGNAAFHRSRCRGVVTSIRLTEIRHTRTVLCTWGTEGNQPCPAGVFKPDSAEFDLLETDVVTTQRSTLSKSLRALTLGLVATGALMASQTEASARAGIRDAEIERILRGYSDPLFRAAGLDEKP